MPDDAPAPPPGPTPDLLAQLRSVVERLTSAAGRAPAGIAHAAGNLPLLPTIPTPGALSAAQVSAIVSTIRALRGNMESLQTSINAFDQQLEVLEQLLEPLESWTDTWARVERRVTGRPAEQPHGPAGE